MAEARQQNTPVTSELTLEPRVGQRLRRVYGFSIPFRRVFVIAARLFDDTEIAQRCCFEAAMPIALATASASPSSTCALDRP